MTSQAAASPNKTVHLVPRDSEIKRLCFDDATGSLRPNLVLVNRRGEIFFEINELGLKGEARDASRRLAVVWGDSVVFGIGASWPCLIDALAPGYQFLNGGIEGDPYDNILRRAAAFNAAHAVTLNILMLGWHPIPWVPMPGSGRSPTALGRITSMLRRAQTAAVPTQEPPRGVQHYPELGAALRAFLQTVPNTVLATMPTALNPAIVDRDLRSSFTNADADRFTFAGVWRYSLDWQRFLFAHITERNSIVRDVASAAGVRLIDLAATFDTENLADFRADFHDMLHLRPRAYAKAAAAVHAAINDLL